MKALTLCTIALLAVPLTVAALPPPKTPPPSPPSRPESPGHVPTGFRGAQGRIYVGESAPGFELTSAWDRRVKLSSFIGGRVLLCFADRREMLTPYRTLADSLLRDGVVLVGVARESPRSLRGLAERDSLAFELLSDPTGEVSAIYGSYDFGTSTIRPGYVLVGRTGAVRMALLGQRLPASDLLKITRYALIGL